MKNIYFLMAGLVLSLNAMADIKVSPRLSSDLWDSVNEISKIENLSIIKSENGTEHFALESIECIFEMYDACSFFADIDGARKLIVSYEGSSPLILGLERAGVALDSGSPRLQASKLTCTAENLRPACVIVE